MTLTDAPAWCMILFALLLVVAALEDLARMRISNLTVAALILLAVVAALVMGVEPTIWQNGVIFLVLLALGTALFSTGKFGGGDAKLLAAGGLWFNFGNALPTIASVFLAGGVLAILIIAARSTGLFPRRGFMKPGSGIPYGVAIAAGLGIGAAL